ncbi:MAG: hypothetical protein AB1898_31205 [Acidobacteriota bacterium]
MIKLFLPVVLALIATAQTNPDDQAHKCHVYLVDLAAMKKAFESYEENRDEDAFKEGATKAQRISPEFAPRIGEEQLTTRHYDFPESELKITASVYYTDESMASAEGQDSMAIGVTLNEEKLESALDGDPTNAIAEVTLNDHTDTLRAKQYVEVKGRQYLLGIECRCKTRATPTK